MQTIENLAQLKANARAYMDALANPSSMTPTVRHTIMKTLSTSRRWFAIKDAGDILLVPAKFGGYADMTPARYDANRKTNMHGGIGEKACLKVAPTVQDKKLVSLIDGLSLKAGGNCSHSNATVMVVQQPLAKTLSRQDRALVDALVTLISNSSFNDVALAKGELVSALA